MDALIVKNEKAVRMFENLIEQTHEDFTIKKREFDKPVTLPQWI
jgi:hypothetical protein